MDAPEDLASAQTLAELVASMPSPRTRSITQGSWRAQLRRMIRTMETLTAECYVDGRGGRPERQDEAGISASVEAPGRELTHHRRRIVVDALTGSAASGQNSAITGLDRIPGSGLQDQRIPAVGSDPGRGATVDGKNCVS